VTLDDVTDELWSPRAQAGRGPLFTLLSPFCSSTLSRGASRVRGVALSLTALAWLAGAAIGRAQGTDTAHAPPPAASPVTPSPTAAPNSPGAGLPRDTVSGVGQATTTGAGDSAIQRAQTLVAQGHTDAGRALVDSVLATTPPGSMTFASALYARASLAVDADSAEEDYRRITVEYSSSPRAADALLRLAQLELARGDRAQAADHLARLTREQLAGQSGITYARTELQIGLAYFDLQDATHACGALMGARSAAPTTDVELRNRIDYNIQRCPRVAVSPTPAPTTAGPPPPTSVAARTDSGARTAGAAPNATTSKLSVTKPAKTKPASVKPAATAPPKPAPPRSVVPPTSAPTVRVPATPAPSATAGAVPTHHSTSGYTVQVAAYPTRAPADSLAAHLRERGYDTRVFGTAAPFRVRVGRYTTEAAADAVQQSIKAKGTTGFVTAAEPVTTRE